MTLRKPRREHPSSSGTAHVGQEEGAGAGATPARRRGAGYELIAGHRRFEAAQRLGWTEIAAVVRDETDEQAYILTLVENLQREDLEPKEEAAALEERKCEMEHSALLRDCLGCAP